MKKSILIVMFLTCLQGYTNAQTGSRVLIEEFTETGCGACAQYDSAFQALTNSLSDKVAVLNYHCFYMLDTFYQYNKACDNRYIQYQLHGYPQAVANGMPGDLKSTHITGITRQHLEKLYNQEPNYQFEIAGKSTGKKDVHSTEIKVKVKALKEVPGKDLRLFIAVTENNINHIERYHKKSINEINEFNHIVRAFIPTIDGTPIGEIKAGKTATFKASFTNDDKEINYKEVEVVVFVQDYTTKEVLGTAVLKGHPF
jgi:hypothetical protein